MATDDQAAALHRELERKRLQVELRQRDLQIEQAECRALEIQHELRGIHQSLLELHVLRTELLERLGAPVPSDAPPTR